MFCKTASFMSDCDVYGQNGRQWLELAILMLPLGFGGDGFYGAPVFDDMVRFDTQVVVKGCGFT